MDSIVEKIITKHRERALKGKSKYNTTMDRKDLTPLEWLTHAQEEAMDFAVYLEKLIQIFQVLSAPMDGTVERPSQLAGVKADGSQMPIARETTESSRSMPFTPGEWAILWETYSTLRQILESRGISMSILDIPGQPGPVSPEKEYN